MLVEASGVSMEGIADAINTRRGEDQPHVNPGHIVRAMQSKGGSLTLVTEILTVFGCRLAIARNNDGE